MINLTETIPKEYKPGGSWRDNFIIYELVMTVGIFFAIGGLGFWHATLITKGETCIESYINEKQRKKGKKSGKKFINPFNRGPRLNWIHFLGLHQKNISWLWVLLPSRHLPTDDGLQWQLHN